PPRVPDQLTGRAHSCSARPAWRLRARRAHSPDNRKGALQTDRVARGPTRSASTSRLPSDALRRCGPSGLLPLLQQVVKAERKSFHTLPAAVTPGGLRSIFFRYSDLKDCLARCSSTRK